MKKILIIFLTLTVLLTACSHKATIVSLNQLSENYCLEDAKADNCVVYEDGDITYGQSTWDDFTEKTESGELATVRLGFNYGSIINVGVC